MLKYFTLIFIFILSFNVSAQDLLDVIDSLDKETANPDYITSTFKGTRVVNGHSVETRGANQLDFIISHRFGTVNKGIYELFGLDDATIRYGFDYSITDNFTVGFGRSSIDKTYDGFLKYKILRQRSGAVNIPVSVLLFSSAAFTTLRFNPSEQWRKESSRLSYAYQVILARKFSDNFSLQISPTMVHRNFVETNEDQNDVFSTGFAGRFKLTKRFAVTGEYFYVFPGKTADDYRNAFSVGFDIETGGHVFQIHCTNAQGMIEKKFIAETTGSWADKEIYIGFNISRLFSFGEKKEKAKY